MDKNTASSILHATLSLERQIAVLDKQIPDLADEAERERIRKALGDVIGILTAHIVFPIVKQYPELDPDKG